MEQYHYEHIMIRDLLTPYVFHRSITANKNHNFPAHWHESIELLYIVEGECDLIIDVCKYHLKPGCVACVNSEEIHYMNSDTEVRYHALLIPPSYLQKIGLPVDLWLKPIISVSEVSSLYDILYDEAHEKKPYYKTAQNAALNTLLVHLFRNYCLPTDNNLPHAKARFDLMHRCIDFIHHNYLHDISTADISSELGITINYLCSYFKKTTGTTVKKYINELRCHDAEVMLASGKYTVMEVGANCGFNNMAYFAKTYHSIIGVLPSETLAQAQAQTRKETGSRRKRRTDANKTAEEDFPTVFL